MTRHGDIVCLYDNDRTIRILLVDTTRPDLPLVPDSITIDAQIDLSCVPIEGLAEKLSAVVSAILVEDIE